MLLGMRFRIYCERGVFQIVEIMQASVRGQDVDNNARKSVSRLGQYTMIQ